MVSSLPDSRLGEWILSRCHLPAPVLWLPPYPLPREEERQPLPWGRVFERPGNWVLQEGETVGSQGHSSLLLLPRSSEQIPAFLLIPVLFPEQTRGHREVSEQRWAGLCQDLSSVLWKASLVGTWEWKRQAFFLEASWLGCGGVFDSVLFQAADL